MLSNQPAGGERLPLTALQGRKVDDMGFSYVRLPAELTLGMAIYSSSTISLSRKRSLNLWLLRRRCLFRRRSRTLRRRSRKRLLMSTGGLRTARSTASVTQLSVDTVTRACVTTVCPWSHSMQATKPETRSSTCLSILTSASYYLPFPHLPSHPLPYLLSLRYPSQLSIRAHLERTLLSQPVSAHTVNHQLSPCILSRSAWSTTSSLHHQT